MPQREVEVILMRQLASYLTTPIFLADPAGDLLYFNEPAEAILGRRFEETGPLKRGELWRILDPHTADGTPLGDGDDPLTTAHATQRPAHGRLFINGLDGVRRQIEVMAFPLVGQGERLLGGVAIFWEVDTP